MKKTATLIAALCIISGVSFAQYDHNVRDHNYDRRQEVVIDNRDHRMDHDHNYYGEWEKNRQIEKINFKYDKKIERVAHNFFIGRHRKEYIIADLQNNRDNEIRFMMAKFHEKHDGFIPRDNDDRDYGRRDR